MAICKTTILIIYHQLVLLSGHCQHASIQGEEARSRGFHQCAHHQRSHQTEGRSKVRGRKVRSAVSRGTPKRTDSVHRQALRYVIRNTALPQAMRTKAQLELANMHSYTRPTSIQNRCVAGGVARGVFRAFRMGRFQFRMQALEGNLPGVKKASW